MPAAACASGVPRRKQTRNVGVRIGVKSAAWKLGLLLGFPTIGGRKKKSGFPPVRVPSEIANDGAEPSGGGVGMFSEQAATAASESHARRRRCMSESSLICL